MTISRTPISRVAGSRSAGLGYLPAVAFGIDLLLIATAILAGGVGRSSLGWFDPIQETAMDSTLAVAGPAMAMGWLAVIAALGGYRAQIFGAGVDEYKVVINSAFLTAASVGISCYLARFLLPRGFFVLTFVIGIPLLLIGRFALRRGLYRARNLGSLQHRVVIAGSESHVDEIALVLNRERWLGYRVIGAVTPLGSSSRDTRFGVPLLGSAQNLAEIARAAGADVVFIAGGALESASQVRDLVWELEHEAIQVVIAPGVTDVAGERIRVRPVGGLPLIHLEKPRSHGAAQRAKRAFDIFGSLGLLLAFSPILLFAAFRIWRCDHGPMMFRQVRVGRDGTRFSCWKFRTMVTDAEQRLDRLHAEQGYQGGLFKMENDPRVTAPGRWLRRFSLDELPQLVNVLRGDMSLVGPRPPLEHEVAQYDGAMSRRLRVRPGMTGLWQVSGRSDLSWSEAIRLDLYYVDNWSMVQDLTILARTFGAVVRSKGAY